MLKTDISNVFFFALLLLILYGMLRILEPFAGALLAAFCLAVLFEPLYERAEEWLPKRSPTFRSAVTVFLIFLFLLLPVSVLIGTVVSESENLNKVLHDWSKTFQQLKQGNFSGSMPWLSHVRWWMHRTLGLGSAEFQQNFVAKFSQGLEAITSFGAGFAQNTLTFLFHLFIMLFTLFFFFRDGDRMVSKTATYLPLPKRDTRALIDRVQEVIVGVLRGWFLTSIMQGILATAGYLVVGLEGAVLLGVLTAGTGLIPVVGTFGVWVPVAFFLFAKGPVWKGVFILLWGAFVVVGFVDTLVRPYLVGQRAEMPILPLFFALLGGVEVFGVKGVVLGPLLVALAPFMLEIYRHRYLRESGMA